MERAWFFSVCAALLLVGAVTGRVSGTDEPTRKRADGKAERVVAVLQIEDVEKATRVKTIVSDWLVTMWRWHERHDDELADLWTQWRHARAVVPKDEFPGEVIAHRIDGVYSSLKPAYRAFIEKLSGELTAEQVDSVKEWWSRSPGMTRTYNAYLEIVPDLTEEQKRVIHERMLLAREDAMLTDSDREIIDIFKRHKVKVEQYVGTLAWAKLHKAYVERGEKPATAPSAR